MLYVTWHCFCNEVILRDFGCCAGSLIDNSNNIPLYVSYELCETFAGVLNQPNSLQMNIDTASLSVYITGICLVQEDFPSSERTILGFLNPFRLGLFVLLSLGCLSKINILNL